MDGSLDTCIRHVLLPDSMAGCSPVPALLHAATVVTVGVLLLPDVHFCTTKLLQH